MMREQGMMGDMFGNMSFDSSDDDEDEQSSQSQSVLVAEDGAAAVATIVVDVASRHSEVGYLPLTGPAILVRQIRERGLSFQLWPAATGLCQHLENAYGEALRGARVVELGAGTGMAGVMAARFGARVTLTDMPHVVPNLQSNVDLNVAEVEACGGSLAVQPLRWGVESDITDLPTPDLVLASDCVYNATLFESFMQTLKWLCGGVGVAKGKERIVEPVVLLAHMRRWKKDAHFFRMAAKCFEVEVVHKHPLPANMRVGVVVYKFSPKLSSR